MNELRRLILERIESEGPLSFADYMEMALYHPVHGYYSGRREQTGWRGHFVTSSEVDPAFGSLWARAFERAWDLAGRPDVFSLAEVGPGEGGFINAVLDAVAAPFATALRVVLVERDPARAQRQAVRLGGRSDIEWAGSVGDLEPVDCVFANEVLDNVPVRVVERRSDGLFEIRITAVGGELSETAVPLSDDDLLERVASLDLEPGNRIEVSPRVDLLVRDLAERARTALFVVDYGYREAHLVDRPAGAIACYSEAGPDARPLERPGEKDITAHVNWDAVLRVLGSRFRYVAGPARQADVLRSLGLPQVEDDLKAAHRNALAGGDGAAAVRALSRRSALGVLTDEGGLGGLEVAAGSNVDLGLF